MPKTKEITSWEEYLEAHSQEIPAGKENEYVAKSLVAYKNKNSDPPVPFNKKKAEKDAALMMKNPLFVDQMQNNRPEIMAMMAAQQFDKVVDKTIPPLPYKKDNIDKAYSELGNVQQKMHNKSYGIESNPQFGNVLKKVDHAMSEHENPQQSEFDQLFNLADVFTSVRKMMAGTPGKGPARENMLKFGLDIMTALGGGKEAVEERMNRLINDTYSELERTTAELKKELGIEEPKRVQTPMQL